ncbi:MAG: biotin/lipoate A/B protein ligase family protein [Candidatus Izemoplasmatales bacterium]|nr:biotin/lipoate A/B protein ligase family protein [Candidatus Izemoplasmatales bacterium]
MALLISESKDPYFNLALEEYILRSKRFNEDVLLVWQSEKAFIFGRNQNPFIEIHPKYWQTDIPIIRRISGGGTIYQDQGTLVFSIITSDYESKINDYEFFLSPLIDLLNDLGILAYFKPKSHVFIDNRKISGNAQAFINNRLLHHGTVLFNADLNIINEALVNYDQLTNTNFIASNKQMVANIASFISADIDIFKFKKILINRYLEDKNIQKVIYDLAEVDVKAIESLANSKYRSWEWNFGKTKRCELDIIFDNQKLKLAMESGYIVSVNEDRFAFLIGRKFSDSELSQLLKK